MTPVSCASTITARLNKYVRNGDVDGFRAFVDGSEFIQYLVGAGPKYRRGILRAYGTAHTDVERRARYRLVQPRPIGEVRVDWKAPGMLDRLRAAYANTDDDEKVGRRLGITTGAARLARKRVLAVSAQAA
jgi:hypothetical protein